ncbi:MAG: hypothetical protein GWN93_20850, partial [Deltaproteobacteria bacterium]|nr:hypothetical protein [Deltaproteobacteria bacterium]
MKSIVFIDLMNYFKMSLAKLGESMGYPKLHIDFNTCTTDELARYCRNDVYVMVQAWKKWTAFLRENDLGVWAPTLPAQAFNAFRHRFMSSDIMIHSHQKALDLERDAYHGGRTEVFRHGFFNTRQYYLLDVNSMYPAMMKHRLFPTALVTYS